MSERDVFSWMLDHAESIAKAKSLADTAQELKPEMSRTDAIITAMKTMEANPTTDKDGVTKWF